MSKAVTLQLNFYSNFEECIFHRDTMNIGYKAFLKAKEFVYLSSGNYT